MRKETLQNLLHQFYPEWDESIFKSREKLGFSFTLSGLDRWDWFASGKCLEVSQCAKQQVATLKMPVELVEYWVCCFYSNYRQQNGIMDLTAVKGPPFLEILCPSSVVGEKWTQSLNKARSELMSKYSLKMDTDIIVWFSSPEASSEVGSIALNKVKNLSLPESYAMAWVCCFLPQGAKWMVERVLPILKRFPQLAGWRQFICSVQHQPRRVRAYPFVIDWSEGADEKYSRSTTMWDLQERGIDLATESDALGNMRMKLSWRPEVVQVNELRQAVEYAQRYYYERLRPPHKSPLHILTEQFIHKAKVIPTDQRKLSASHRFTSGETTFEQLLCEEALTPEVQNEYQKYSSLYQKSPASMKTALKEIRSLRKKVYDRVRSWLLDSDQVPKVERHPPWWSDVLPKP